MCCLVPLVPHLRCLCVGAMNTPIGTSQCMSLSTAATLRTGRILGKKYWIFLFRLLLCLLSLGILANKFPGRNVCGNSECCRIFTEGKFHIYDCTRNLIRNNTLSPTRPTKPAEILSINSSQGTAYAQASAQELAIESIQQTTSVIKKF